jgi:hypothetical protein
LALNVMLDAASILPGGASLALQLTLQAVMARNSMDVVAPLLGSFGGVSFQVFGVFDAWRLAKENPKEYNRLFWVRAICTTAQLGMMVWSARARCFVAGTPVVIDYAPALPLAEGGERKSRFTLLDGLGGVAIVLGLTMLTTAKYRRRRRDQQESNREQTDSIDAPDEPTANDEVTPMRAKLIDEAMAEEPDILPTESAPRALPQAAPAEQMSSVAQTEHYRIDSAPPTMKRRKTRKKSDATRAAAHPSRRWSLLALLPFVIALLCFAPRIARMWSQTEPDAMGAAAIASKETEQSTFLTKPIEEIRPGDRVLAYNPEVTDAERAAAIEPDPATWRLIELELVAKDAHQVEIRLLRPLEWIERYGAVQGRSIQLDVKEIGVSGTAAVLSILPCPEIMSGPGMVVTGAFRHIADNLIVVQLKGAAPITCTSGHPFWSHDRKAFVEAKRLRPEERLMSADGKTVSVVSINCGPKESHVFNLEVDFEDTYFVGERGVLVLKQATGELVLR